MPCGPDGCRGASGEGSSAVAFESAGLEGILDALPQRRFLVVETEVYVDVGVVLVEEYDG